jgi:hypothetical protein
MSSKRPFVVTDKGRASKKARLANDAGNFGDKTVFSYSPDQPFVRHTTYIDLTRDELKINTDTIYPQTKLPSIPVNLVNECDEPPYREPPVTGNPGAGTLDAPMRSSKRSAVTIQCITPGDTVSESRTPSVAYEVCFGLVLHHPRFVFLSGHEVNRS